MPNKNKKFVYINIISTFDLIDNSIIMVKKKEEATKPIEMNMQQYAKSCGIKQPAVSYRVKNNRALPGVISYDRSLGWTYRFLIDPKFDFKTAKKLFAGVAKIAKFNKSKKKANT